LGDMKSGISRRKSAIVKVMIVASLEISTILVLFCFPRLRSKCPPVSASRARSNINTSVSSDITITWLCQLAACFAWSASLVSASSK